MGIMHGDLFVTGTEETCAIILAHILHVPFFFCTLNSVNLLPFSIHLLQSQVHVSLNGGTQYLRKQFYLKVTLLVLSHLTDSHKAYIIYDKLQSTTFTVRHAVN